VQWIFRGLRLDQAKQLFKQCSLSRKYIERCSRVASAIATANKSMTVAVRPMPYVVIAPPFNTMGNHVTKDELRAELERQAQRYMDVQGGEIITYAAQPDPARKPWRKKANLLDQAFEKEIEKIEKDLQAKPDEHSG
jgi:hypothetical protein